MKIQKIFIIIILSLVNISIYAQLSDKFSINLKDVSQVVKNNNEEYDNIIWKSDYTTQEVGNPELPVYRVTYVLPVDAKVSGVTIINKERTLYKKNILISPVQEPIPTDNRQIVDYVQPNSKVYESDNPYPGKFYEIESDEFFMGYHIVTLLIYPFEYLPESQDLYYYPEIDYTINYTIQSDPNEIKPLTQSQIRAEQCKSFVKSLVKNSDDVDNFGSNAQSIIERGKRISQNKGIQKVKSVSVLDEITPDYIIITCDSLKSTFQTLADWKSMKGVFTIIKTVEEIADNYSGIDLAEKVRKYIIDVYTKWGAGLYVLLGGDINIVPARMVVGYQDILNATDMYYSTYIGNWNANGNSIFGESNDNINYSKGVIIGRIPVKNATKATSFINKIINYEKANMSNINYVKNNLYSDAYISISTNKLTDFALGSIKNYVSNYVPSNINNKYICDNANCRGDSIRYLAGLSSPLAPICNRCVA